MVSYQTGQSVQFNNFKGIRTRNGVATGGVISALKCKNIDFEPSSYDASINIVTSKGNIAVAEYTETLYAYKYSSNVVYVRDNVLTADTELLQADETPASADWEIELVDNEYVIKYSGNLAVYTSEDNITLTGSIVKGFGFETENTDRVMLYITDDNNGRLVEYYNNRFKTVKANINKKTKANAITMLDNAYNTFVFTNGVDYIAYNPYGENVVTVLQPEYDGNAVNGLALAEQDGSLVIGCSNGIVLASAKGDITDFDYNASESLTKAWYQLFGKPVTAVVPYIDALLVFTSEDSTILKGNFSSTSTAERENASLGGCMSFESWVKHDKYLFFYDNNQKNVYYYMQNDYGQKVLGEPLANEILDYLKDVRTMQMVSYIGRNRSEIWLMTNEHKLIFDYFVGEWTERVSQNVTSYFVSNNDVYSTFEDKILKEKSGNAGIYDGEFIGSEYTTQIINLGSFSNLKEMEFQPLLSVTQDNNNIFTIKCTINGKKEKSKEVQKYYTGAIWASDSDGDDAPDEKLWDKQVFPKESSSTIQQIKGKFISSWYYLQFTFETHEEGEEFAITNLELKGITQETDTIGVK